jgi:phenylacetic acid degradation operon negative regulatory protein
MGTRTQDLIFTLYGDYLRQRGGVAWIGSLIAFLDTLDVSEQAVRATASRMARKGWLQTDRRGRNSYYGLTEKGRKLLDEGARQIFQPLPKEWDGRWYLVTYTFSDDLSSTRHQLRQRLAWLGFGQLGNGTLISPRNRAAEVHTLLDELDAHHYVHYFCAEAIQFNGAEPLADRCWDLTTLNLRYREFIQKYCAPYEVDIQQVQNGQKLKPKHAFRQRFWLIHEYRYFPFADPYLPPTLLPDDWPGETAVTLFQNYHTLLEDQANMYVDELLARAP